MVTWNTYLGMHLTDGERDVIERAYAQVASPVDDATDGAGLAPEQLRAMPWAIVRTDTTGSDVVQADLAERVQGATAAWLGATECSHGTHGASRSEPSVMVNVRLPESLVGRMDEGWETRSECIRAALAFAQNAGIL